MMESSSPWLGRVLAVVCILRIGASKEIKTNEIVAEGNDLLAKRAKGAGGNEVEASSLKVS